MGVEIERKFLVNGNGYRSKSTKTKIKQGFLCLDENRIVRVRIRNGSATLNIKGSSIGATRAEFEYNIPIDDAENLLAKHCLQPIIKKVRYKIRIENLTWEIDEFEDENEGLILAEVELPDEDYPFTKPNWIGKEVTSDSRYYNANLLNKPYNSW